MRSLMAERLFLLVVALAVTANVYGAGPADPLFQLSPPEAGVTFALEDLRGHTRQWLASPLVNRLSQLPIVRTWVESPRFTSLQVARSQIEAVLGARLDQLRDDLLGDAVVLTLRVPPRGRPEEARGLLLTLVRDPKLLHRLIQGINDAQLKKGELLRITERSTKGVTYSVREMVPTTRRPDEYYTILSDQTFAWSNSETMIQEVIERSQGASKGLGDHPGFRRVRELLPARSIVSLFVDPRFLELQIGDSPRDGSKPSDEPVSKLIAQYVQALDYIGLALEWRPQSVTGTSSLILHAQEVIDPERLASPLKAWASSRSITPKLERVPPSAIAAFSANLNFKALEEIVRFVTPASARAKLENLLLSLRGLMLGRDLRTEILPKLGPSVLAYTSADRDGPSGNRLAHVALIEINDASQSEVSAAIDNGLQTLLSIYALNPKNGGGQLRVESRKTVGYRLTTLIASTPFAYAIGNGELIIGDREESVAGALAAERTTDSAFSRIRAEYFPDAESLLCIDLQKLCAYAERHRDRLARRVATKNHSSPSNALRDLDHALSLIRIFDHAFLTTVTSPDARSTHRMLGLIVPADPPTPQP